MSDSGSGAAVSTSPPLPPAYHPGSGVSPAATGERPPRPMVPVAAALLAVGGLLLIVGSAAEWYRKQGRSYGGFTSGVLAGLTRGPVFVVLGAFAAGVGLTQLVARRFLAAAAAGVVVAVVAIVLVLGDLNDMVDQRTRARRYGIEFHQGPGLWVILAGAAVALAGGITALARRRVVATPVDR